MSFINPYRFAGGSSCPSYTPGLYTAEEIDTLVNVDGYIPVASISEFKLIGTMGSRVMGAGTCWEDTYTTSPNEKYIQVENIDASAEVSWSPVIIGGASATMVYDGNLLFLENLTASQGWFSSNAGNIKNCIVSNTVISGGVGNDGILVDVNTSGALVISNCEVLANCSLSTSGVTTASICGVGNALTEITNCINRANVTNLNGTAAGICGTDRATITNCKNYGDITANSSVGGISHQQSLNTISECENHGTISCSASFGPCGGITGRINASSIIEDCSNFGDVTASGIRTGGIAGGILGQGIIRRCKSEGASISTSVNSTNSGLGGIIGYVVSGTGPRPLIQECEVINCIITGSNQDEVGGICGSNFNTYLTIENCRVDENTVITGDSEVGGILGRNSSASTVITNSYSAASVNGNSFVGGAVGNSSVGTYNAVYWDTTTGPATSAAGTGQTTSALQTPTSPTGIYSAWSAAIWDFGTSSDYPELINTP